ncbi:hypothetical protein CHS0354_010628 [Potamilus streckersoni]|uniref:WD repeat-containing protein 70 n=1 Tax=Potamilus streckersoni TaxID=2493646 RepID=A0AAE0SGY5_9BIVA|nr:hypothetical protein CHS0354_010628 [Potamilus streckersoni]
MAAGSSKKARQFDFMAMFEEARQTAFERFQGNLVKHENEGPSERTYPESHSKVCISESGSKKTDEKTLNKSDQSGNINESSDDLISPPLPQTQNSSQGSKLDDEDNEDLIGPSLPPSLTKTESSISDGGKPEEAEEDDDLIGPPIPPRFKQTQSSKPSRMESEEDSDGMIGPPLPPSMMKEEDSDENEDDDNEEEEAEDQNPVMKIPSSHEITLEHGFKTVSALALDPSGARLVTGGYDFDVRLFDFAGMDSSLKSFRSIRPCECHQIKQLQYSTTGDVILVVAGNSQAKVIDRDGFEVLECVKGDQYITDMAKTKGHAAMLNCGCWHPKIREEFMTCSNDGTLRLWDINQEGKKHKDVIKPRSMQGRRIVPTACTYSPDGRWVVGACQDGSIQIWDHSKAFVNVAMMNRAAHMSGSDTSCLCFSYDGRTLASRGGDDTVKLWDIRNFKSPVVSRGELTNFFPMTDLLFSPDDKMVVTGLSVKKSEGQGKLLFMDRQNLSVLTEMVVSDTSVVRCLWHPRLNQIVVGSGDGKAKLFYDPKKSHRGAMLCMVKKVSKDRPMEIVADKQIITPYALPMFRQARQTSTKKFEEKLRRDPVKTKRPDLPVYGPGSGGRLASKGGTLSQYVVQQLVAQKPDPMDNDPRGAILRHAKEAEENPYWVAPAYKKTQPNPIFQMEEDPKEEKELEPAWKKRKI